MSIHNDASITTPDVTSHTKKRKHDEIGEEDLDRRAFVIRDPSTPFSKPRSLTPLCLLARAQLPLACLDTSTSGSRLFSAYIQALEASHAHQTDAAVLVAQDEKEKRLYAIERVKQWTYALCRLGEWVGVEALREKARVTFRDIKPQRKRQAVQAVEDGQPWWKSAAVDVPVKDPTARSHDDVVLPKLAMQRVMEAPAKTFQGANETDKRPAQPPVQDLTSAGASQSIDTANAHANPQDILQDLAKQYMDALYLSRTSLAYFTKGPLSRARAAFSIQDSSLSTHELIDFLRGSILSSSVMEKKYRSAIASLVKDLPVGPTTESPTQAVKAKKKRRKWKPKRDKSGLFMDEQDVIERWWRVQDDLAVGPSSVETTDEALKRRVPKVRNRETFLQIIVILEVLGLEASAGAKNASDVKASATIADTISSETQGDESQAVLDAKKVKPKKSQDLSALLETLLDRLCIWHSLESHSPAKKAGSAGGEEEGNDELKSFCVEVVIPFYVPRIPHYASIVNKKLGGPSAPTPVKRRPTSSRKPGEPAVRQPPEKKTARRPLERISSGTLNQAPKRAMPSLHRSATDSDAMLPYIKRESRDSSEAPSLNSIPPAQTAPRKRSSLLQNLSSSRREVDLSAVSQANEAKLRKKAEVEEKLKEAISTLRKPNRPEAVKELKERTDEKFAEAAGKKRSVHVAATPSKHVKATPRHRKAAALVRAGGSSGSSHVPSSSAKFAHLKAQDDGAPASTPAVPATGHRPRQIMHGPMETPSRGFAKLMPAGLVREPGTLLSLDSPIASPKAPAAGGMVQQTPSKTVRNLAVPAFAGIENTPMKRPAHALVEASHNAGAALKTAGGRSGEEMKSVYKSLGWDDDDDGYEELV